MGTEARINLKLKKSKKRKIKMSRNIGIKNLTQLLAFSILTTSLISCGQPSNNNQSTTSDTSEVVEFIPVETFAEIDVNQAGKVTAAEFIDYYVVKVYFLPVASSLVNSPFPSLSSLVNFL